jgi:hypothetical protein
MLLMVDTTPTLGPPRHAASMAWSEMQPCRVKRNGLCVRLVLVAYIHTHIGAAKARSIDALVRGAALQGQTENLWVKK